MTPEFQDRLARQLDGELTDPEAEVFWRDLESPEALDELLSERELDHDLRRLLSPGGSSDAFVRGVLAAGSARRKSDSDFIRKTAERYAQERRKPAPARRRRLRSDRPPIWAFAVAAALLIAIVLAFAVSRGTPPSATEPTVLNPAPEPDRAPSATPRPAEKAPEVAPRVPQAPPRPTEPLIDRSPPAPRSPGEAPPKPEPRTAPPAPPPNRAPAPRPRTVAVVATVTRAQGSVMIVTGTGRTAAKAGGFLVVGSGMTTGAPPSSAILRFPDGTEIELAADSSLAKLEEGTRTGKRVHVSRGTLTARVTKQPARRQMVFTTSHGEARVLGTTLRLHVTPDATRLEVSEGKVRLVRPNGRSVDVTSGHFAVASAGTPLTVRPWRESLMAVDLENAVEDRPPGGWQCGPTHWTVAREADGNVVARTTGANRFMLASVGDPSWSRYLFTFDARGPVISPMVLHQSDAANYKVHFTQDQVFIVKRHSGGNETFIAVRPDGRSTFLDKAGHSAMSRGGYLRHGLRLRSDRWYSVRVEVTQDARGPLLRARLWPKGTPEPRRWLFTFIDPGQDSPAYRAGRVGFFGYTDANAPDPHVVDNVRVEKLP